MHPHRGQPGDAGATQQIEEQGFCLIIAVVRGQQHSSPVARAQRLQGCVAGAARLCLQRLAGFGLEVEPHMIEGHLQARAFSLTVGQPGVRVGAQAMVYVQCHEVVATEPGKHLQQDAGVQTARQGEGDAASAGLQFGQTVEDSLTQLCSGVRPGWRFL